MNCGHSTLILFKDGYQLTFDFQYNKQLCNQHLSVAKEFVEVSKYALEKNLISAFVDNCFSAIELLAKTNLFLESNQSIIGKTTHKTVKAEFNKRFKNSEVDIEIERREAFNKLSDIRSKARYLDGTINIDRETLFAIQKTIEIMLNDLSSEKRLTQY